MKVVDESAFLVATLKFGARPGFFNNLLVQFFDFFRHPKQRCKRRKWRDGLSFHGGSIEIRSMICSESLAALIVNNCNPQNYTSELLRFYDFEMFSSIIYSYRIAIKYEMSRKKNWLFSRRFYVTFFQDIKINAITSFMYCE